MACSYVGVLSIRSRFKEDGIKLKIVSVKVQGDAKAEYLMLQALEDCNLSSYAVVEVAIECRNAQHAGWPGLAHHRIALP